MTIIVKESLRWQVIWFSRFKLIRCRAQAPLCVIRHLKICFTIIVEAWRLLGKNNFLNQQPFLKKSTFNFLIRHFLFNFSKKKIELILLRSRRKMITFIFRDFYVVHFYRDTRLTKWAFFWMSKNLFKYDKS